MMKNLSDILRYVSPEENEGESTDQNTDNEDPTRKARRWPISRRYMEAALQDICEYNDISEEQLVSTPETIVSIEMFLYNFPHICCMSFFPNLVSLSLVQQNLLSIEGLHYCPHLELLRLSENSIQRIEGLGNCLKLKELFLHSNRINRITGVAHLTNLDVLWLSNNEIRTVDGLGDLRLKELSLARNPISQLGEVLNMKELEFLNVSATNIGSFKEIGNLTRLKNLKDVRFSDPQWGDSPLALLHNYQTYILFRLRQLQSVDTVDLTDEAKQAARAMYTRKRVYYNMCIKSLQQNRNNTNPCLKADIQRIKSLQKNLSKLIKTRKDMEKEMCEEPDVETARTGNDKVDSRKSKEWWVQIKAKISIVHQQISNLIKHLDNLRTLVQLGKAKDQAAVDLNIHWLMLELDTGGNIRMEVGNSKDVWFKSCMDLVMSRFFPVDFVPFSISGMQVLKVTRIHNRFLQDRFERTLEGHIQKGNKKHVEYLLYGETLQASDELQWIIEEGFPFSNDHNPNMSTGAVVLSNSIGLADMCRLQAIAEQTSDGSCRGKATGWLLVVKTCLGASVRDITHAYTRNPRAAIVINGVLQTEGENFAPAKKTSYPHADSVYRTHPGDPTQRSWSVFDSATVVPEYLVEYEYSFKESGTSKLDPVAAIQNIAKLSNGTALTNGHAEDVHLRESEGKGKCHIQILTENECPNSYDLVCSSRPHSGKGVALSVEYLQRRNGLEGSFLHLSYLNLHNCNITGVDLLRGLPSLKVLVLSFNKISQITGLQDLCVLERLDMSYNLLKRIDSLSGLNHLITLDLAGNEIWCLDDLGLLQLQVPGLLNLNLRSNPIVDELSYYSLVLRALSSLAELDSKTVTTEDRIAAMSKYSPQPIVFPSTTGRCERQIATSGVSLSFNEHDLENAINFHRPKGVPEVTDGKAGTKPVERVEKVTRTATPKMSGQKQLADPFRLSPYRLNQFTKFHRIETSSKRKSVHSTKEGPACCEGVEEVHLEQRKLKTMYCFDRLPNLRRLFLSGNELSVIAGLDNCTMLEELILDDNVIKQVSGISKLQSLWRLDLGCNQLTSCIDVGAFTTIEQLSIDNNLISCLKGIEGLVSLMELYAQNNQLTKMVEINYIRDLPKLMVVNFCGNAFCEARDYRLYTIYSLRKLKVLDSVNVNSSELADARNKYTGRLQKEVVEECVGHKHLESLQVLDLSEQKIRHCGNVFESFEFRNLRELNLNNNMISSLHPLRYLSNLLILRLENNSIENGPLLQTPRLSPSPEAAQSESEGGREGKTVHAVASTSGHALPSLEVLELSGNNVVSIMSLRLSSFPMLKHLSLQDNKITKVDGMENLKHLEHLYLNHNCIKELDPGSFASLPNLRVLHFGDNSLKTLVHIGGLISLESLDLTSNLLTPNRLGGFASIDYLSPLPKLTKLWLNNNPMSRQNQYRNSVISRLEHLELLDGRPISQEERQDADAYASGKELNTLVLDPNVLLESTPNSTSVGGQIKVPLKVTSLNFDTMCASQPTILNGLRGYGINQASTQNTSHNSHLNTQYNSQKQWEQFDSKQVGSLVRKGSRVENKLFMLPFQTFLKNVSPGKERIP